MEFKATDIQIRTVIKNAVNNSKPVGMGYLHFKPIDYTEDTFIGCECKDIYIDYFEGRMVKLRITYNAGTYKILGEVDTDYQSWGKIYPTTKALLKSAGILID